MGRFEASIYNLSTHSGIVSKASIWNAIFSNPQIILVVINFVLLFNRSKQYFLLIARLRISRPLLMQIDVSALKLQFFISEMKN